MPKKCVRSATRAGTKTSCSAIVQSDIIIRVPLLLAVSKGDFHRKPAARALLEPRPHLHVSTPELGRQLRAKMFPYELKVEKALSLLEARIWQ